MNKMRGPIATLTLIAALTVSQALAQTAGDRGQGLVLAGQICSECHAIDLSQGASPNSNALRFRTDRRHFRA